MRRGKKIAILFACLAAMGMTGCGRVGHLDERERNNRIVSKAYEMANQGDYDAAIMLFTKALETYPRLSRPHLDLALLLHDRRRDYVRAIYHYTRYLELRPGTEKGAMIKDRIRLAERAFGALHTVEGAAPGKLVQALEAANSELEQKNAALDERVLTLEREIAQLRDQERQRYKAAVVGGDVAVVAPPAAPEPEPPSAPVAVVTEEPPAPAVAPPEPEPEPATATGTPVAVSEPERSTRPAPKPAAATTRPATTRPAPAKPAAVKPAVLRTYTVRRGDSLSKIAYKVYGDATEWRRIQSANRESLGDSVNVKVGQVLVVP